MPKRKTKAKKKPKRILKPRTRGGGTWTEAGYFGFIRGALRRAAMRYPPKLQVKMAARRPFSKPPKGKGRQKWEYKCQECNTWNADKNSVVDHVIPAGTLKTYADLPQFVENLFCEPDGLRMLCKPCHQIITNEQNAERRK